MRYFIVLSIVFFTGCDYGSFDKDKRQIMAKDYIERHLSQHARDFDIESFKEDTINYMLDSNFSNVITYSLNYHFTDSVNRIQQKKTTVLFTPDGHSIITSIDEP